MAQEMECEVCGEQTPEKRPKAGELNLCEECSKTFGGSKAARCC